MPGKITLTITTGPKAGTIFLFKDHDTLLLGRARDCQVCLAEDQQVSRHHFILEMNPPDIRIRDLGSRHGTYVNGQRYGGRSKHETPSEGVGHESLQVDLHNGDEIRVGKTTFLVRVEAAIMRKARRCLYCHKLIGLEDEQGGQDDGMCATCREEQAQGGSTQVYQFARAGQSEARAAKGISVPDYKILQELGRGGMGVVYLAEHNQDGRQVALKVMRSREGVIDERAHQKFMREMDATRTLQHPHIITFLDSGVQQDMFYFLMEFCEGGNVASLMRDRGGRLTLAEAGPIMLQTLQGLAFAHKQDFVHRDLKPQNILLRGRTGAWSARLADLGLAKNFEQAGFSGLTMTGEQSGTYQFMPREQVTDFKRIKPVSDVWAMGATCYYLLTGAFPRNHLATQDQINVILYGEIMPIHMRDQSIPKAVAEVINRSLAVEVSERYQDAEEMYQALKKAL